MDKAMKQLIALILGTTALALGGFAVADGASSPSPYEAKALSLEIQELVEEEQYNEAIDALNSFIDEETKSPDAWNYLGYSLRKVGLYDESLNAYKKALKLDKKHLGANEYIGELYLTLDKPSKAKKHLKRLAKYCGDCAQHAKLAEAIAAYENGS